jgi:hypothetical protein
MPPTSVPIPKYGKEPLPATGTGPPDEDPRHRYLADYVRQLLQISESFMANRWPKWQDADKRHRCYVDVTEVDEFTARTKRPHDVKLVLPTSYTIHESILAYLYSVFTTRDTLIQIESRPGRNPRAAFLMEEILNYNLENLWHNGRLKLYAWLNDTLKYGCGIEQDEWIEEWRKLPVRESVPMDLFGIPLGTTRRETREWKQIYKGNQTWNIDPYSYLPDPRVPVSHVQDGDFAGYCWWRSWLQLKQGERDGRYQNIDYVEKFSRERYGSVFGQTQRFETLGMPTIFDNAVSPDDRGFVVGHTLWLKLVPTDFDLGEGDDPEIWLVSIANYDTIIRCERWDYDHAEMPFSVLEANYDGYSPMQPGITELLQPLQDLGDWIIGSHMDNVKKFLNDMLVIDPSRINLDDLRHPGPAKWLRLRENAWGTDVRQAIMQLPVQDVTGQFLVDYQQMAQMMNQAAGAVEPQINQMVRGKRQQATVMQGMVQLASARHKVTAQILSALGIRRWARRMVANIQQNMDEPMFVRVTGQRAKALALDPYQAHILEVDPEEVAGDYDYPVHTGDVPVDPARMVEVWKEILFGVAKIPQLGQRFDLVEIFRTMVQNAGVKNIDAYLVKTEVAPDEDVMGRQQRGDVIPMQEAMRRGLLQGRGGAPRPGAAGGAAPRTPSPGGGAPLGPDTAPAAPGLGDLLAGGAGAS